MKDKASHQVTGVVVNNFRGWIAIFDDDASKSWDVKIYTRDEVVDGKTIHYIGL